MFLKITILKRWEGTLSYGSLLHHQAARPSLTNKIVSHSCFFFDTPITYMWGYGYIMDVAVLFGWVVCNAYLLTFNYTFNFQSHFFFLPLALPADSWLRGVQIFARLTNQPLSSFFQVYSRLQCLCLLHSLTCLSASYFQRFVMMFHSFTYSSYFF